MLRFFNRKLRLLCSRLGFSGRRSPRPRITVQKFGRSNSTTQSDHKDAVNAISSSVIHPAGMNRPVRIATFNAALFSMAPVVPKQGEFENQEFDRRAQSMNDRPKSILKQSPLHPSNAVSSVQDNNLSSKQQKFAKSRLRVSINLPDNEISLKKSGQLSFASGVEETLPEVKGKAPLRYSSVHSRTTVGSDFRRHWTVVDVLREINADVLALQDVKAEEEKDMKPLSDLAEALGMEYVFAESWAPEYGNAILSKYPIKRWNVQKIFDDNDFRNVLKATIDVPEAGEIDLFCTLLDHLDEKWRMKQINAIIQSTDEPYILAGGLNSLDETDYSHERWTDIVKYYEDMGKPTPKIEVMKHLKSRDYTDAKDFAGECESVVMIAKGQSVQGTCKYGTRVDYILSSADAPYKFVPGSYSVLSSKGTSDHHIVKVDVIKVSGADRRCTSGKSRHPKSRTVRITHSSSPSKGVWKVYS